MFDPDFGGPTKAKELQKDEGDASQTAPEGVAPWPGHVGFELVKAKNKEVRVRGCLQCGNIFICNADLTRFVVVLPQTTSGTPASQTTGGKAVSGGEDLLDPNG